MTDPTKATRAKIAIGDIAIGDIVIGDIVIGDIVIDGFMLPDGSYRMSQRQIAEIIDLPRQSASDFLRSKAIKVLLDKDYTSQKIEKIPIEPQQNQRDRASGKTAIL